ncbi:hypothetical protein JCM10212_004714 [Sporobolomyces blumeae]
MPSTSSSASLPVIDLSPFLVPRPDDREARRATAQRAHRAIVDFGFFYLTGIDSLVSLEEMDDVLDVAKQFFDLPDEDKRAYAIKPGDGARGWQKIGQNVTQSKADHHEGFDLYRPARHEDPTKLLHGPNPWPANPRSFRPKLESWIDKMQTIGLALMEATAIGLGVAIDEKDGHDVAGEWDRVKGLVEESFWVTRVIGYPPLPRDAEGISCGAHKDYGNFTLLHTDATKGALQVFVHEPETGSVVLETGERGHWLTADPKRGMFVCNIGEMWEILSAGLYKSTLHRVIHQAPTYRISLPFFYEPAFDAVIEPLPTALRLRAANEDLAKSPIPDSVIYGEFLTAKVSNNFAPPSQEQS